MITELHDDVDDVSHQLDRVTKRIQKLLQTQSPSAVWALACPIARPPTSHMLRTQTTANSCSSLCSP